MRDLTNVMMTTRLLAVGNVFIRTLRVFTYLFTMVNVLLTILNRRRNDAYLTVSNRVTNRLQRFFRGVDLIDFRVLLRLSTVRQRSMRVVRHLLTEVRLLLFLLLLLRFSCFLDDLPKRVVSNKDRRLNNKFLGANGNVRAGRRFNCQHYRVSTTLRSLPPKRKAIEILRLLRLFRLVLWTGNLLERVLL